MYKIIGADQKEYGPITAEQMRFWITEGRVNASTQARAEGTSEWKALGSFTEFADVFGLGSDPDTSSTMQSDAGREAALQAVKIPAIALIVTASLAVLYYAISGAFTLLGGGAMFHQEMPPNVPPQLKAFIEGMQGPLAGIINLVIVALNAVVLFGGIKLLRLQNLTLVMVACVMAMLPCSCCCLLGLPFGIWALVVVNKPEVKKYFS